MFLWKLLISILPREITPRETVFWTDGYEILTTDYDAHVELVDCFEDADVDMTTGYYDPKEDECDGCVDKHTKMYYATI